MSCQQPTKGTALRPSSLACRWHLVGAEAPSGRPQSRRVVSKDVLVQQAPKGPPELSPGSSKPVATLFKHQLPQPRKPPRKPIVAGRVRSATRSTLTRSPNRTSPWMRCSTISYSRAGPAQGRSEWTQGRRRRREAAWGEDQGCYHARSFILLFKRGSDRMKGGRAHLLSLPAVQFTSTGDGGELARQGARGRVRKGFADLGQ